MTKQTTCQLPDAALSWLAVERSCLAGDISLWGQWNALHIWTRIRAPGRGSEASCGPRMRDPANARLAQTLWSRAPRIPFLKSPRLRLVI
jgi:hypothetical protein